MFGGRKKRMQVKIVTNISLESDRGELLVPIETMEVCISHTEKWGTKAKVDAFLSGTWKKVIGLIKTV